MSAIRLVARREIRERIKARSFRIATLISVAAIVAVIVIPAMRRGERPLYDVGVVNPAPTQIEATERLERELRVRINVVELASVDEGRAQVRSGRLDVLVVADDEIVTKRKPEATEAGNKERLVAALEGLVRLQRVIDAAGPDANRILEALRAPVAVTGLQPPDANARQRLTAFLGILILFVFLQQYGTWVLMGVIEEKTSRVVEVLLAAVKPRELVAGKVLGIGAVAIAQGVIVAVSAIVAAQATGTNIFEGTSRFTIAWTLGWFALGYGLYAWVYAAIGSLVSRQADAQNAAFPLSIPVLIGYISATSLLAGSDPSGLVRVLSFLPPTAPMVMPMLIGLGKVSGWEIALSIVLVLGSIAVLMRVAGDVYSRAILHTGQRLRLRQVLRGEFTAV